MKMCPASPAPPARGFTLVEMLVVIAIIAILAAILVPTLAHAKTVAKRNVAKVEMLSLAASIQQYETEYKRMPGSSNAVTCAVYNEHCHDFTYGTTHPDGTFVEGVANNIISYGDPRYQASNAELLAILRGMDRNRNPRNIVFYDPHIAAAAGAPGLGPDGVLRDPWGNPYIISLDMDDDGKTLDGYYGFVRKSLADEDLPLELRGVGMPPEINVTVMVWSFGPDGKVEPTDNTDKARVTERSGFNKDNIVSWE